jgi:hypothetical protein
MARKVDKRSRALRRNLRKQARKGTLSAREQQDLLTQEARFRKAARQRRPYTLGIPLGVGAGLGAAALLGGDIFSRLGGAKKEGVPSADSGDVEASQTGAATTSELLRELEAMGQDAPQTNPDAITYDVEEQPVTQVVGGPGVGETASEPSSDDELIRDIEEIEQDEETIDDELARASLMDPAIFQGYDDYPSTKDGNRYTPPSRSLRSDAETGEVTGSIYTTSDLGGPVGNFHVDRLTSPTMPSEHAPLFTGADRASNPNQRSFMRDALADLSGRNIDDPRMEAVRRLEASPIYDYVAPPGEGTPTSQGKDAQQRAQNQLASARMQDALDRGNEYNELMRRLRAGANTIGTIEDIPLSEEADIPLEFGDAYLPLRGIENFDMPEEADIPLEDFPMSTRRERAAMAREAARARNRARRAGVDGIPVRSTGPRVQAIGGKNPSTAKLMKRIKAKYGMK